MGRYAYFNTGFDYKFAFGIQESSDILYYGGKADQENYTVSWSPDDKEFILSQLRSFGEGFTIPDFDSIEKSPAGTLEIYMKEIYDKTPGRLLEYAGDPLEDIACFALGCIIYHQLLYKPDLSARYEA
jgi:hypothetical protein